MDIGNSSPNHYYKKYKKIKKENSKLLTKNHELENQISLLKNQFEKAIQITSSMEEIHAKNSQNEKEVLKLKIENQELQERLKLATKFQQESAQRDTSKFTQEVLVSQIQQQCRKDIEEISDKLNQLENEKQEIKTQLTVSNTNFSQVFKEATDYFDTEIETYTQLIQHFKKSKSENLKNISRIGLLKSKLKECIIEINELNESKSKYKEKIKQLLTTINTQETNYINKISEIEDINHNMEEQIDTLSNKNITLMNEISEYKSKLNSNLQITETENNIENQLIQSTRKLHKSALQNKKLNKKLKSLSDKAEYYENKCKFYIKEIHLLRSTNAKYEEENQINSNNCNECLLQIKNLEIDHKRNKEIIMTKDEEIKNLNETIDKNYIEIKENEKTLKELQQKNNEIFSSLKKQSDKLNETEYELQIKINENEKLKKDMEITKEQSKELMKQMNEINNEILSIDFPLELKENITEIIKNEMLLLPNKIRNIFYSIVKFYNEQNNILKNDFEKEKNENSKSNEQIHKFLSHLCYYFPETRNNTNVSFDDEKTQKLLLKKIDIFDKEKKEFANVKLQLNDLYQILNINSLNDIKQKIFELQQIIKDRNEQISKLQKKNEKLNLSNKNITENIQQENEELNVTNNELQNINEKLLKRFKYKENKNKTIQEKLLNENQNLKKKIEELNAINEENEDKLYIMEENNKKLQQKLRNYKNKISFNTSEIEESKEKIRKHKNNYEILLNELNESSKTQISELQNVIKTLNMRIKQIEEENKKLEFKNNELILEKQKMETQKNAIISECKRDKKSIESQLNAKIKYTQNDYQNKIDEIQSKKEKIYETISNLFSQIIGYQNINDSNVESLLKIIQEKIVKDNNERKHINKYLLFLNV